MMGRLFWKILFGFWLTLVLVMGIVDALASHYNEARQREANEVAQGGRVAMMTSAVGASLHHGGIPALQALFDAWPPFVRDRVMVVDADGQDVFGRPVSPMALAEARRVLDDPPPGPLSVQQVHTPEGNDYLLFVMGERHEPPPGRRGLPPSLLICVGIGSLAFSAVLAWYLARPLHVISSAFGRVAEGDLSVRVGPRIGRRRDEIADLGRDFDSMADRLAQLVDSQKRLLHDVSHELRSPLARLQVAVGLARQQPEKIAATLDRIDLEAHRLDAMVGELLTLSRLEAGAKQEWDDYFSPVELVEAIADDARFEAEASGIRIDTAMTDPALNERVIHGRAELLHRAFDNLVRNAIKYSITGQTVWIAVEAADGGKAVLVRVTDQGPGVPEDQLARIFEPFVRLGGEGSGGYGLGLAIAQRAVVAHGGTIVAANAAGGGLAITVTLPLAQAVMGA